MCPGFTVPHRVTCTNTGASFSTCVASIAANNDPEIGDLLAEAMDKVKKEINNKIKNISSFSDQPRKVIKFNIINLLKNKLEMFSKLFKNVTLEELNQLESDFLVVSFEGLMSIFKSLDPRKYPNEAAIAFKLFLIIMTRFKKENGS